MIAGASDRNVEDLAEAISLGRTRDIAALTEPENEIALSIGPDILFPPPTGKEQIYFDSAKQR